MKNQLLLAGLLVIAVTNPLWGQHAGDIEFGLDDVANPTSIMITPTESTCDGIQFFESEFEELDPFTPGDFSSDEPGFTANPGIGFRVNSGDRVWLETVDASLHSSFGVGFVNFFNPNTGQLEASGEAAVVDNSSSTADLILSGDEIVSGPVLQFVDIGSSTGNVHDHIVFDLLNDAAAPVGAYGMMFQLKIDLAPTDGEMDVESQPFWIIWNYEMLAPEFEDALAAFGGPGAVSVVAPATSNVVHGTHVSGGTAELAASDNADLSVSRRSSDISSRVTVQAEAISPAENPASLQFEFEGAVFARSTVVQTLELWNFNTSAWEEVDSRNASRFVDASVTVDLSGDLTRFVEAGTGTMRSRVRFVSLNARQRFTANIDRIGFVVEK